jgi:hypothetical protein
VTTIAATVWVFLAGCTGPDRTERDPASCEQFYADADGDGFGNVGSAAPVCAEPAGYVTVTGDCDDTRYGTRPGADELCNERDDDCDGLVDDDPIDPSTWFLDDDGDGYGTDDATAIACSAKGYAHAGGDCDDGNAFVHPGADEICDEADNDCDEQVDAADPGLQEGQTWYADADFDGYGNPSSPMTACSPPLGGVANDSDCDDGDGDVHPGSTESCDGLDNDCSGVIDDLDDPSYGADAYWPDADGDGYGTGTVEWKCVAPPGYAGRDGDCDDADSSIGAPDSYYADADGDGYGGGAGLVSCAPVAGRIAGGGDCNDASADVHPGAVETCNGHDDDCNGFVDGSDPLVVPRTWYGDGDGDGFGDDADTVEGCAQPSGYVAAGGDCDDGDALLHPGATEWCDALDNDCDGTADGDVSYVDWYADDDGDGFGDDGTTLDDCVQPSGYTLVPGDCDDSRADASPAASETCRNDLDDDCDALVDECPVLLDEADLAVEGTSTFAQLAAAMAVDDLDGDGTSDLALGAPTADGRDGAVWLVFGPATGALSVKGAPKCTSGELDGQFGSTVASGDADDDGAIDLLVGAPDGDSAFVFLGPVTSDSSSADVQLRGDAGSATGEAVAAAGDVDGDGHGDLLLGAPDAGPAGGGGGAVYAVSGAVTGTIDLMTDATYTFEGGSFDAIGTWLTALGDVDGDGIEELAIGTATATGDGAVYVVPGGAASGTYDVLALAEVIVDGLAESAFGTRLASADWDNDGVADLFVGAPETWNDSAEPSGAVFAFLGPLSGFVSASDATTRWYTRDSHASLGQAIAADGDVDGDKQPDVLLGAPDADVGLVGTGSAYLQLGFASGVVDVETLLVFSAPADDAAGASVAFVPDWDGDDGSELAIGAPFTEGRAGAPRAGSAFVILSTSIVP